MNYTLESIKTLTQKREPRFGNLRTLLAGGTADRAVLFELFMNDDLYSDVNGGPPEGEEYADRIPWMTDAFRQLGYDYVSLLSPPDFRFPKKDHPSGESLSQNDLVMIRDRRDFEAYPWPRIDLADFSFMDRLEKEMPPGMKAIPLGPGGVLENTTDLLGFDNMCYLLYDDPDLLKAVFDRVGENLLSYYRLMADYDCVGALMANDDWGFATQTMLTPDDMRRYVFPWHSRIARIAREKGKSSILHSCGNLTEVMDDVIETIGHKAKHSYEDKILPVEQAWEKWGSRIGIFGGLDMDFLCRSSPEDVYKRSREMLEKTGSRSYALGTGNSVPEYIPRTNYLAMITAGLE